MNDSIDQNVYSDLHSRVNDGDDGEYGVTNKLERLNASRDHVVLGWDQDEPLAIHTDLTTCQLCGNRLRAVGGRKACKDKRCDKCGWSVMRHGFPALVKLDHEYPQAAKDGDVDSNTGEAVPGYTTSIDWLNELGHKNRRETPDVSVRVGGFVDTVDTVDTVATVDTVEHMTTEEIALTIQSILVGIAMVLFLYRLYVFWNSNNGVPIAQVLIEACLMCYFPVIYIVLAVFMLVQVNQGTHSVQNPLNTIRYKG